MVSIRIAIAVKTTSLSEYDIFNTWKSFKTCCHRMSQEESKCEKSREPWLTRLATLGNAACSLPTLQQDGVQELQVL